MEVAILSLLDELGDESQFVEYWYRDQHKDLSTHRDVGRRSAEAASTLAHRLVCNAARRMATSCTWTWHPGFVARPVCGRRWIRTMHGHARLPPPRPMCALARRVS